MTALTKDNLDKLIKERLKTYEDENNAVQNYNIERQTIGDYNGRQILELIQNADDAGAETIRFKHDTVNNELVFYNDGVPFDLEGIKSILIAYDSSKVTSSYIGNKGLGFRSILNWADSVTIYSAGLKIDFSPDVLKRYLSSELTDLNSKLPEIRRKRNLSNECIPLPILGLPCVCEESYEGCNANKGCALVIHYNEDKEKDVIDQIKAIDEQTLLFLRNIKTVEVPLYPYNSSINSISVKKDDWKIHCEEKELEERYQDKSKREKKKYSIKIAIPTDELLETTNSLYNYLPSKEMVHLPFLLHATVELNSSRNHVVKTPVNDFILEKAAGLICQAANDVLKRTQGHSNWTAYRMMTPTVQAKDYGSLKVLYDKLDDLKRDMAIYPTVDNQYAKADDYCYYNDTISGFWEGFGGQGKCSKMLQPVVGDYEIEKKPLVLQDFVDAITEVSKQLKGDIEKRVCLIRHLYENKNVYNISFLGQVEVPLLIDNNNSIIEGEAYVQDSGDEALTQDLPSWVGFKVVCSDLVKELIKVFPKEIEDAKQQKKRDGLQSVSDFRCLVGLLDCFVSIGYFDKTGIANRVVSQANEELKKGTTDESTLIVEMLNFLNKIESDAKLKNVSLLNKNEEVMKADELMLPTELNKQVFEGTNTQYVLDLEGWKGKGALTEFNEEQFEGFMKRLGVNRILDEKKFEDVFYSGYGEYLDSHKTFSNAIGKRQCDLCKGSEGVGIPVIRDMIMEKLQKISLLNVLRFVSSDEVVLDRLKAPIELSFFYNRNWRMMPPPHNSYNYIRFQLSLLPCVKWKVFGSDLVLDEDVDVDDLGFNAQSVVELVRTDFRYEKNTDICAFLNDSPTRFPKGKNIRKLYKLLIDGLTESGGSINNVCLYASDVDGNKDYHPSTEVFYSDNTCLPKKVIEKTKLFRLDYPSRQGVDKITKIFGLRSLDDLNFKMESNQESRLGGDFDLFFRKLKPYLLLYAIQNASKQSPKKTYASDIKNCRICLVSQCECSIDGVKMGLGPGEFVNVGNEYYLNVYGLSNIDEMKSSTTYCNAITEILGMVFKLETKNEHFIHVFQGFDFMKRYIDENRKDEIDECYRLLGLSPEEKVFWETYGELKKIDIGDLDNVSESPGFYSNLGFKEQEVKKVDFSNWSNKDSIDFLEGILQNLEKSKHSDLLAIVNLSAWHKNRFDYFKELYRAAFVHKLWTVLNNETYQNKRNLYFPLQDDYSYLELESQWKHELKEDKDYLGCLNQKVTGLFQQNGITEEEIVLEKESAEIPGVLSIYSELFKSVQDQKDMGENSWWLYFEGNEESIKAYLETLKQEVEEEKYENGSNEVDVPGDIVKAVVVAPTDIVGLGQRSRKKSVIHTTKSDKAKARVGAMAEQRVDKFLRQQEKNEGWTYGEWVSKRNDSAGYDFTYLVDGQTRYLEVKASSPGNTFILTANEYEVAKKNIDVYDIAIVDKDGKVTIYQAFFKGQPRLDPKDYDVSFCLPQNP